MKRKYIKFFFLGKCSCRSLATFDPTEADKKGKAKKEYLEQKAFSSGTELSSNSGCRPDRLCLLVVKNDQIPRRKRERKNLRKDRVITKKKKRSKIVFKSYES